MRPFPNHRDAACYAVKSLVLLGLLGGISGGALPAYSANGPVQSTAPGPSTLSSLAALPLQFEVNAGQAPAEVEYLSRGSDYSLSLTATGATLTLHRPSAQSEAKAAPDERPVPPPAKHRFLGRTQLRPERVHVRWHLVGANPRAAVSGVDQLPGRVHYVAGTDPTQWHTDIATYARVKYAGIYPGIDLFYYGNSQRQLEYDFHVAPGADPRAITMRFEDATRLAVDAAGDLVLHTAAGEMRQRRPVMYQDVLGVRQAVAGDYVITGEREVGFHMGLYDASHPLVIDPVIVYSTYLGGSGYEFSPDKDAGNDIAVDAAGNMYVVGSTNSLGRYDADVFVRKFDPSGSRLLYETYLDSNGTDDAGFGIAVDEVGNAYVTGKFGDGSLGKGLGVLVAKLNTRGTPLYEVTFGADSAIGYSDDVGIRIAVNAAGNAYVVGTTFMEFERPFPTTLHAFQRTSGGGLEDAFVVKLDRDGRFVYATLLGRGWR